MHIRAADVDLIPTDLTACRFVRLEFRDRFDIIADRKAADVCHDRLVKNPPQRWQLLADHRVHTGILQADGIDHAVRTLRDARRGIAEARLQGRPLKRKTPQTVDIIKLRVFAAVAEGAAGRDHRVVKRDTAEFHFEIYHRISSLSSTGPSLQIRLLPYLVSQEQPMQAPKPQPMRSSKLYCPEVFATRSIARNIASGPQV